MKEEKKCSICKSTNRVCSTQMGLLCSKHYLQFKRHGKILSRTMYDSNDILLHDNYAEIILYNRKGEEKAKTIIDLEDVDKVKNKKWTSNKDGYVISGSENPVIYLHRYLLNATRYVDHIDGNVLNNCKNNLREVTNADNLKNRVRLPSNNTSGIIGVRYRKDRNKWYTEIQHNGIKINLGSYTLKEDAIKARTEAEIKYFGDYKSKILNNEIN